MKNMCILAIAFLLAACASARPTVTGVEASTRADFSGYRSYSWSDKPRASSVLGRDRVVADIDTHLHSRGWLESEDADILIIAKVDSHEKKSTKTFYSQGASQGWGLRPYSSGRVDSPMPPTTTIKIDTFGILTIDVVDAKTHQSVWRGESEVKIPESPGKLNSIIDAGVDKLFSRFPTVSNRGS
ncbi:MAG: DUF4136 domain-containing protein [Dokdonella sp.]